MNSFKKEHNPIRALSGILALILLSAFITVTLSGCYFFPKEEEVLAPPIKEPEKVTFETIEVKKGTIENTVRCTGTFVSVSQKDVYYVDRGGRLQDVGVYLGDKVKQGQVLAQLETDTILNDIKLQELAVKRSQLLYDNAKTRFEIEGGSKLDMETAMLDLQSNQIRLDNLNNELAHTRLVSPIDGTVVFITDTKLGEYVNAHQTIVRVADPTKLQLRYSGDEVGSFKLGMTAKIDIDEKTYDAEVVMTPGNLPSDADEESRKSVMLDVKEMPAEVEVGNSAGISLTLEKHDDVIVLPKQLINNFVGRKFVNVLKNDLREERDVELGIQTDTDVEVVKGLDVGEQVIVR